MKLHALPSLFLMAAIALSRSTAAQETTPNPAENPLSGAETAAPDVVTTGGESPQVTYENPVPEFLRGKELLPVLAGQRIVTIPVSSMNWLDLDAGDVVRVDFTRKGLRGVSADDEASTLVGDVTLTLVESARIYAISSFAPADSHAPVCLIVTPDEARKCMESLSRESGFVLTVVEKQPKPTLDTPSEQPPETVNDLEAAYRTISDAAALYLPPAATDETTPASNDEWPVKLPPLSLEVDRIDLVTHDSRIKTVDGFDPSVIEVVSVSPRQIRVTARSAGSTTITLVDEQSVRNLVDVVVLDEHAELKGILRRLYPEASIEVISVRDSILLRGTVVDGSQVEEIVEIAECFAPQVLNQLRSDNGPVPETETSNRQIPAGLRVITIQFDEVSNLFGLVRPNDHVDVVVTYETARSSKGGRSFKTDTIVSRARVFSVDHTSEVVSLLCTPSAVNAVRFAESNGELGLSWREPIDVPDWKVGVPNEDLLRLLHELSNLSETTPSDRTPPGSEASDSSLEALRSDLRALHDDVRQLIEILKQRAEEPAEKPEGGAGGAADRGAVLSGGLVRAVSEDVAGRCTVD